MIHRTLLPHAAWPAVPLFRKGEITSILHCLPGYIADFYWKMKILCGVQQKPQELTVGGVNEAEYLPL